MPGGESQLQLGLNTSSRLAEVVRGSDAVNNQVAGGSFPVAELNGLLRTLVEFEGTDVTPLVQALADKCSTTHLTRLCSRLTLIL